MESVGYLGPEGSYSHIAAGKFRPEANLIPYPTFLKAMRALINGGCDLVALPIENSLNGSVDQNIDLLQSTDGVFAFEEYTLKIDHRLATLAGADESKITRIYSHQQALGQCTEYLSKNFPAAELIATSSTAASLKMLKSDTDGCIVGAHTHVDGVALSAQNIADNPTNETHFLLIKKGAADTAVHTRKIYFSATCRDEAGALCSLLEVLKRGGINMSKIQSRPIKDRRGEYMFFIEIEGDFSNIKTRETLEEFKKNTQSFKILGAY